MAKNLAMGSTDAGKAWCIKALHPSDPVTEVRGIPDESSMPTVFLNYQSTFTLRPPGVAEPTWEFDATLTPHPVSFLSAGRGYTSGSSYSAASYLNSQLTGATHAEKYATFRAMCERWRLAYMSVTVYQDGAALTDQGTMAIAQVPVAPRRSVVGSYTLTAGGITTVYATPLVHQYQQGDQALFERSQAMPNAYFNRSKEGAYVPLKLGRECVEWVSGKDSVLMAPPLEVGDAMQNDSVAYLERAGVVTFPVLANKAAFDGSGGAGFPFIDLKPATRVTTWSPATGETGSNVCVGDCTSPMCAASFAHISGRGLSTATNLQFFVRAGFEAQVQPASILSPEMRLSPAHDEMALTAYFSIARELKDAYPADYNDLGKIWDVIKKAAAVALPLLKHVPYVGPIAAISQRALASVPSYVPAKGSRDKVSRSDLERAKEMVSRAARTKPRRAKK